MYRSSFIPGTWRFFCSTATSTFFPIISWIFSLLIAYADGILTKWYQAGVHHKADIPAADAAYKRTSQNADKLHRSNNKSDNIVTRNKFNNFAQNTYDFDALEQNILSN